MSKNKNDPSMTSLAYDRMKPRWDLINAVLGGTETLRKAEQTFLPMHEAETAEGYKRRLEGTVFINRTEQVLNTLSSKPFADGLTVNEDVPTQITEQVLDNVDLLGNNLEVFAKQWFKSGLAKGFCHVLVDYPRVETDGVRTLADDREQNLRPYWVLIEPECVLYARASVIDGKEVLEHVRIMETITEQDGFIEKVSQQIRILERGSVSLWRKNANKRWTKAEEWETGLDFIPLVTFYTNREGLTEGKPPLLDLAYLNIAHWQSVSDQRHILKVSRFPILACSGATAQDSDPVVVGPNKILYNPDPSGRFYYVEHTGTAIQSGENELKELEQQMSNYGAEFLKKKSGSQTATARALDSAEALSDLSGMVMVFEDAVSIALWYTALWIGLDDGGTVELLKDFNNERIAINLDNLDKARQRKDISRKTYLQALVNEGVLPESFNADDDLDNLAEETTLSGLGQASIDLDPQQADEPQ